jgi:hypothetical protein
MPEPTAEHLKRQLIRLVHARVDVRCAAALAEELLQGPDDDISYRAWGLLTGMVVSYARPFTDSHAYGKLEQKWSKVPGRPELERHHVRLLEHRRTLLAHNDLSPHREVVVFPSWGILRSPAITEGRSPISLAGIREVAKLFRIQDERMDDALRELVERLEKLEGWTPDQQVRLSLDDV